MSRTNAYYQKIVGHIFSINRALKQQCNELHSNVSELTLLQIQTLIHIKNKQKIMMTDLAQELHISKSALAVLVNRLVEMKWLDRIDDPTDRRIIYLELSKKSHSKLESILNQQTKSIKNALIKLSPTEITDLNRIIEKLDNIISQKDIKGENK
jgi:DNA-binding MarR family transcriptional regulator